MKNLILSLIFLTFGSTLLAATPNLPENYVYLRCNSTSWTLQNSNLMKSKDQTYTLTYRPKLEWMKDVGEHCVFTVTDQKGTWTAKTKEYVATLANGEVALESNKYVAQTTKEAGENNFLVRYSALVRYTATLDLKTKSISFKKYKAPKPAATLTALADTYTTLIGTATLKNFSVAQESRFSPAPYLAVNSQINGIADITTISLNVATGRIVTWMRPNFEETWVVVSDFAAPSAGGKDPQYLLYVRSLINDAKYFQEGYGWSSIYTAELTPRPELLPTVKFLETLYTKEAAVAL